MVTTNKQLVEKCIDIAKNYKTLYVMGCFGAPMNETNKKRYCKNHSYNKDADRTKMIQSASSDTFGFDCVNLIKGILWGWNGDKNKTYGGATYNTNGVPDTNADGMIKLCKEVSTDFSKIEIGEAVWLKGHIGVYIGGGLAVECTPSWKNCVQITSCNCDKKGYNRRNWTKHGKLPYITYEKPSEVPKNANKTYVDIQAERLVKGSTGDAVKALQTLLVAYGYASFTVDSIFGDKTLKAVKDFQAKNGTEVDGIVGVKTWSKLLGTN